jgi:sec-independent protein translocase protein TatB
MFDIAPSELLLVVIVAIVVIGPRICPRAAHRRAVDRQDAPRFQPLPAGIETMIREAELADMEKKWQEQNARIMAESQAASAAEMAAAAGQTPADAADQHLHMAGPVAADPVVADPGRLLPLEARAERPRSPQPGGSFAFLRTAPSEQ